MTADQPPPVRVRFARYFLLLGCATLLLILAGPHGRPERTVAAFGWYGALHAVIFVSSLRDRRRGGPIWPRTIVFVASAAALAMMSAVLTLWGSRSLPAFVGTGLVVALCSALGAMSYLMLIRVWWLHDFPLRPIVTIACGCALATLLALWAGVLFWTNGRLWFTVFWWLAISAGLCVEDFRRSVARRAVRG